VRSFSTTFRQFLLQIDCAVTICVWGKSKNLDSSARLYDLARSKFFARVRRVPSAAQIGPNAGPNKRKARVVNNRSLCRCFSDMRRPSNTRCWGKYPRASMRPQVCQNWHSVQVIAWSGGSTTSNSKVKLAGVLCFCLLDN